ncbi:putative efflux system component YknX [Anaerotignum neopropionicum]|uniref:Putative efflux system component YknX n=1 Tax=Anaerotignum neopropionicum TaxID=36847 RepID=A0A136WEF7_9FIRM|nr:efflux RND transporter periplasmic adaptor subunit [Anaerotignum neopropionicum]KXL52877.1 putative efflux system component YknX [Anaerotignum neopropionicum]
MALSKKKKILIAVAGLIVVAVGVKVVFGGNKTPVGMMVSTSFVEKQDVEEVLKLKAVLEGTENTEVVSKLHYEVKELLVKEGDKVKKGQLLAVLDSSDLTKQISLSKGEQALLEMQQKELLEERQVDYDKAKEDYDSIKALFDIKAASQSELDAAKRKLDNISSENGVAILTASEKQTLENTKRRVSIQAETLQDCKICSMIDGTVTRVNTKVGRFADETEDDKPMFVIENIDKLQMKVLVNETDIAKILLGQKVEITADILGGEIVEGVVSRISPTGESKDSNSTERVIPVYIEVVGTNEKLIAGITAKATIHIAKAEQTLTVPYEAVSELEDGATVVYVVNEDNTIHIVPVTIGLETDLLIQIQEGELTEGQQIVLNPSLGLTEGMTVIPQ